MPKTTVPYAEWRPDLALLDNEFAADVENVFVDANSYKPIPSLTRYSGVNLPTPVVGLTAARTTAGQWKIYAGTTQHLYVVTSGSVASGWTDVSRTTGGLYNVPAGEQWSWAQFGKWLIAVQTGDVPQIADVDAGTAFTALSGSPPPAHNVRTLGEFVVLGGLNSNRRMIAWSAINDPTGWTPAINLSDIQEFPDGGNVMGVAGDTIAFVLQDRAVRSMQFLPGDTTYVFNFSKILMDKGSVSEYGYCTVGAILYLLTEDGFFALSPQGQITNIGEDKVNEWFLANSDIGRRNMVQCFAANKPYVIWAYHSSSLTATYDRILIYNWVLQRWTRGTIAAWIWGALGSINLDLDTTGTEPGDQYLDSPPAPTPPGEPRSLDSFAYIGGRPKIAGIDPDGYLCTLDGANLPATLETAERHLVSGQRAFVSDAYPLVDATGTTVAVATRERLQDTPVWTDPIGLEITGSAAVYSSSRLHRFRVKTAAGNPWTHAQGLVVEVQQDGSVA